jgi:hypothetical protein
LLVRPSLVVLGRAGDRNASVAASHDLSQSDLSGFDDGCYQAICFRPAQVIKIKLEVILQTDMVLDSTTGAWKPGGGSMNAFTLPQAGSTKRKPLQVTQDFGPVTVPDASAGLDFVEFSRRAFVQNGTTVAFSGGVLASFKSTDPSTVAPAINLVTDALKSVVLAVPLVR